MKTSPNNLNERIQLLKQAFDLFGKEELEVIERYNDKHYDLYPLPLDSDKFKSSPDEHPIKLSKYVIQGTGKYDQVQCKALDPGTELYKDISEVIKKELGEDYIIVFCKEFDSYLGQKEMFGVKFYKVFNKGLSGNIIFDKTRVSDRIADLNSKCVKPSENKIEFNIDLVFSSVMTYSGDNVSGKNVLFYGFDIESNKYLNYFFKNRVPNAILNIIPFVSNSFLHDNVD